MTQLMFDHRDPEHEPAQPEPTAHEPAGHESRAHEPIVNDASAHEPVRLLIWDLDETFWRGTLTEGGITLRDDTIEIVKQLARRGIVSTICSKNDLDQARSILKDAGVWDYFILPSIDWTPKGPRIATLIDNAQLRPASAMFIDDNPINLEEAKFLVPDLQIRSNTFIDQILGDPLFTGKDDPALTRLNQYKLLERRKSDEAAAGADVADFLRASNIRVRFDYQVIDNLDRAVELINRTNQLNFTKQRLPDDAASAREALRNLISSHEVRAALIGVRDNYGDHGWCGIYIQRQNGTLLQFAFSCRILGLQVETWLYHKLGRPRLDIQGEVLADIKRPGVAIDWIHVEDVVNAENQSQQGGLLKRLVAHGGCDLMPLAHYFGPLAEEVVGEFNENHCGMDARIDHSTFLRAALSGGLSEAALVAAAGLGYRNSDFESAVTHSHRTPEAWILSFWSDAAYVLYKHKQHGFTVPFSLTGYHAKDARQADVEQLRRSGISEEILTLLAVLKSDYEYVGLIGEAELKDTVKQICASAERLGVRVFVVAANEYFINGSGVGDVMSVTRQHNRWLSEVLAPYPNATLLHIRDAIQSEAEVHTPYHFDRVVYFRLFETIKARLLGKPAAAGQQSWALHTATDLDAALSACDSAHTLSRSASFLLSDQRVEHALRFAAKAMELDPDTLTHRLVYLRALSKSDNRLEAVRLRDAKSWLDQAAGLPGAVLHQLGALLQEDGDLEQAAKAFGLAVQSEPDMLVHRHRLANVLEKLGRAADTYAVLQASVARGDRNQHVLGHIARLLIQFARLTEARELLQSCLRQDPDFPPYRAAFGALKDAEARATPSGQTVDDGEDIALNKRATQSSVSPWSQGGPSEDAGRANDGALRPDFSFHTAQQSDPWWQVDLEHEFIVEKICLLNRYNYPQRLRHFSVLASLDAEHWDVLYRKTDDAILENPEDLPLVLAGAVLARYIRVRLDGEGILHFRLFQAFGRRVAPIEAAAVRRPFVALPPQALRGRSWIREFCHRHGLDAAAVRNPHLQQKLCIRAIPRQEFRGDIKTIRIARQFGRFGNVFYQLLNAFIIARRIDCREIQLPHRRHQRHLLARRRGDGPNAGGMPVCPHRIRAILRRLRFAFYRRDRATLPAAALPGATRRYRAAGSERAGDAFSRR
jgi:FkbH-like protein